MGVARKQGLSLALLRYKQQSIEIRRDCCMLAWALIAAFFGGVLLSPHTFAQERSNQGLTQPPERGAVLPEDERTQPASVAPSRRVLFYRPGDIKGVPYESLEQCGKAYEQAGNVGVCVLK